MKIHSLIAAVLLLTNSTFAQHLPNWQNKDLETDHLFGISTEKAYTLLRGKKSQPVIVAVIDAGVDTLHEDLKSVLWVNPKKKAFDNGSYGWSFIGSAKGQVQYDNLELTRQVRQAQQKGDTTSAVYHAEKAKLDQQLAKDSRNLRGMANFLNVLNGITKKMRKDQPTLADFKAYQPEGATETQVTKVLIQSLTEKDDFQKFKTEELEQAIAHYHETVDYQLNVAYDPRAELVGDDYFNSKQRRYGSPDNCGPDAHHGTHVSGIIGAIRHNGIGLDGIADNVYLLNIRAVPNGDERDKDIANAIRYAADHHAKVINMSFGKSNDQDKQAVDEAVQYALRKDVLFIQAAGNEDKNIDTAANFPNRKYLNGKEADAWIVVGASGPKNDAKLKATFSNYGRTAVDVFAPGVQIYSSIPGSQYDYYDGTSMACPVVAGLAALIREYYPELRAPQVKDIILRSVVKVTQPVLLDKKKVPFTDLCRTGGIVNAYQALQLAATYLP